MKHRIVNHAEFEVVGWIHRTTTVGGNKMKSIPKFWNECHSTGKVRALAQLCGPMGLFGLCAEMDDKHETFRYLIGVEKREGVSYPEGTLVVGIPAATYVVMTVIGAMPHAIQDAWKYAQAKWFPASSYDRAETPDFEVYPSFPDGDLRGNPSSAKCVTELWIPLKTRD